MLRTRRPGNPRRTCRRCRPPGPVRRPRPPRTRASPRRGRPRRRPPGQPPRAQPAPVNSASNTSAGTGSATLPRGAEVAPTETQQGPAGPATTNLLARSLGVEELAGQGLRMDPEQLHGQRQRQAARGQRFLGLPQPAGGSLAGESILFHRRESPRTGRLGQLRIPVRQPLRQRLAVHQELRVRRPCLQERAVRRLRPAPDVRLGPPADPDQGRDGHRRRPVLLARRVRVGPAGEAAAAVRPLSVQLHPVHPARRPDDLAPQ